MDWYRRTRNLTVILPYYLIPDSGFETRRSVCHHHGQKLFCPTGTTCDIDPETPKQRKESLWSLFWKQSTFKPHSFAVTKAFFEEFDKRKALYVVVVVAKSIVSGRKDRGEKGRSQRCSRSIRRYDCCFRQWKDWRELRWCEFFVFAFLFLITFLFVLRSM